MIFRSLVPVLTVLAFHQVNACSLENFNVTGFTFGSDQPSDPATLGYTINHMALIVNNLTASMNFYGDVLGMRHIFTYAASDAYSFTYMGYSHGGKNGTGYQCTSELFEQNKNIEGQIELIYLKDRPTRENASTVASNTFSHVGLVVPDIKAAEARMRQRGVTVLKAVGDLPKPGDASLRAFGLDGLSPDVVNPIITGFQRLGFSQSLLVADPDGNMIEVQQQN